jgi:hypothetical protein
MSSGADRPPTRRDIDLLARVKYHDANGTPQELFGNIIELGTRALRLEAARELTVGQQLALNVVFPGQRKYADPVVHIRCVVRKAHDQPNLHYDVAITVLEAEAHERLLLYLNRPANGRPVQK